MKTVQLDIAGWGTMFGIRVPIISNGYAGSVTVDVVSAPNGFDVSPNFGVNLAEDETQNVTVAITRPDLNPGTYTIVLSAGDDNGKRVSENMTINLVDNTQAQGTYSISNFTAPQMDM